jgi:DNA polymerase-4
MATIFLLDIDCFFASVEMAINPSLRGKPLCVGGPRDARGIVSCPNYEARRYGVRTAMPLRTAARMLPPDAVFLPGNFRLYGEYSRRVMEILGDFTPDVEQVSVDEAYLDVTGCLHLWKHDPQTMASAIKQRILQECGLSVSIGAAANRTVAKIAAGARKPDGLVVVPAGTEREFLSPLPAEVVPGVGTSTLPKLHACGIQTAGDAIAYAERHGWKPETPIPLSKSFELAVCCRIASCLIPSVDAVRSGEHREQSISRDRTFGEDTNDREKILSTLYYMSERCCKALRADALAASTITARVRFTDFTTVQKQSKLISPSSNEEDVYDTARRLLDQLLPAGRKVRLVGVKVSDLTAEQQLTLGFGAGDKRDTLHRRLDELQSRHGYSTIRWGITCGIAERREEYR